MPRGGTTRSGLGSLESITNGENAPTELPTDQSDRGNSSLEIPSSQSYSSLCQLDKKHMGIDNGEVFLCFHEVFPTILGRPGHTVSKVALSLSVAQGGWC